jgi:hypothetical protein
MAANAGIQTLFQRGSRDAFRGRLFGTVNTTKALASLVGMGAGTVARDDGVIPRAPDHPGSGSVLAARADQSSTTRSDRPALAVGIGEGGATWSTTFAVSPESSRG